LCTFDCGGQGGEAVVQGDLRRVEVRWWGRKGRKYWLGVEEKLGVVLRETDIKELKNVIISKNQKEAKYDLMKTRYSGMHTRAFSSWVISWPPFSSLAVVGQP
jgi:hypothetical protein